MFAYLRGNIISIADTKVVVDVSDVGYALTVSASTAQNLQSFLSGEEKRTVYVHPVYREDAQTLYGFSTETERIMFVFLLGISKVGASVALSILSTFSPHEIVNIVATQNVETLCRVPGVGTKSAERIVMEAKNKIASVADVIGSNGTQKSGDDEGNNSDGGSYVQDVDMQKWLETLRDVELGLTALGYGHQEIKASLSWVNTTFVPELSADPKNITSEEILTAVMRKMGS